ncbi:TIGR03936 family radical SAM-associated protein [Olsenella sp. YH-ols2217]|uniref:TIGR03936 family radical SAM-associated protein n=1 Tax=Kribbibacterium absianum TaxID=3044210 RepID=A0ABT6ZJR0_9ACTN|nr:MULTISPECIES: TIGR03936 family radical SAM-associated protein [unclassified Olsenella]MDJ1121549.1 TIGR03936 family radical SAM-associated protein [Olsenella sp. YH-ols2216]MDJ1129039.1 TIGR03936 family radical SAM-associated protein [Olsenella sp. YH-ols2217]
MAGETAHDERFRLRLRYGKQGRLRYLGHLDLMRTLERTIRRAGLPYALTQGFNQRMKAAYSAALPVGASSEHEYLDLWLTRIVPADEALAALQAATEPDVPFHDAAYVPLRSAALQAWLDLCQWTVTLETEADEQDIVAAWQRLVRQGWFEFRRGAKLKRCDLERTLLSISGGTRDGHLVVPGPDGSLPDTASWPRLPCRLTLMTRSSNEGSLRPEAFVRAMWETPELSGSPAPGLSVVRDGQWHEEEDGSLTSPFDRAPAASAFRERAGTA